VVFSESLQKYIVQSNFSLFCSPAFLTICVNSSALHIFALLLPGFFKPLKMFKYTNHSLKKLETMFEELDYTVRYEKGNFQSGYCIVENQKVAVINRFFDTEGRINCLLDILGSIEIDEGKLSEKSAQLLKQLNKLSAAKEKEEEEE
jgi:hypothetical protein